jgi:hypothetical protein
MYFLFPLMIKAGRADRSKRPIHDNFVKSVDTVFELIVFLF